MKQNGRWMKYIEHGNSTGIRRAPLGYVLRSPHENDIQQNLIHTINRVRALAQIVATIGARVKDGPGGGQRTTAAGPR